MRTKKWQLFPDKATLLCKMQDKLSLGPYGFADRRIFYLWFYSSQELEIAGKPVTFFPDGVDVELVQLSPQCTFIF